MRLLNWTREHLTAVGMDDARLATEVLLAHVLGCERIHLYARFDREPTPEQLAVYRELIKRARAHEPVAYLVGHREFYSLSMKVTPDVLIPRPESELLVDAALEHLRAADKPPLLWDVCTGSGCVAIASAVQSPPLRVLATDISEAAVAVARENAEAHGVAGRVHCDAADLLTLPASWDGPRTFDAITANPPYIADGDPLGASVRHEPDIALRGGADGLTYLRRMLESAEEFLNPAGLLALEFGYQQTPAIWELVAAKAHWAEPRILKDHQGHDRILTARRAWPT